MFKFKNETPVIDLRGNDEVEAAKLRAVFIITIFFALFSFTGQYLAQNLTEFNAEIEKSLR